MKRFFLPSIILILSVSSVLGQQRFIISNELRTISPLEDSRFEIREYRTDSTLAYRGILSSEDPPIRHGNFEFFDKHGNVIVTGSYYEDVPYGKWIYLDEDYDTLRVINYEKVWDMLDLEAKGIQLDLSTIDSLPWRMRRNKNPDGTFSYVDKMPVLPEGEYGGSFKEYVSDNIVYPIFAKMNGIWRQVETVFIVDTEGRIRYPGATSIFSSDLVIEAIRVLYESPLWEPGVLGGYPVNVSTSWNFMFPDRPELSLLDKNVNINFTDDHRDTISSGESGEELFYIVEEMPTFNGGDPAFEFRKFIAENLQYPEFAAENGVSGRVIVQFAIDRNGYVTDVKVVRSVDPALDREAVRVVSSSPPWTPGKQRGETVKVLFTFPINFVLQVIGR